MPDVTNVPRYPKPSLSRILSYGGKSDSGHGSYRCSQHTVGACPPPPPTHTHTHTHTQKEILSLLRVVSRHSDGMGVLGCSVVLLSCPAKMISTVHVVCT